MFTVKFLNSQPINSNNYNVQWITIKYIDKYYLLVELYVTTNTIEILFI